MANRIKPEHVEIRSYQVGFGDCFLLTFKYSGYDRNVLIDFGSMALPEGVGKNHMVTVAKEIKKDCGGKLDVVVATHRHRDHISGFSKKKGGGGPGDIIASCSPKLVVQPWTEYPPAAKNARTAEEKAVRGFAATLKDMQTVARSAAHTAKVLKGSADEEVIRQLEYVGGDNIANPSAVENLMNMGENRYVKHGDKLPLGRLLPGVKVHVLGPPSLEQSEAIRKMRRKDAEEFWHLQALTGEMMATDGESVLFPDFATKQVPVSSRWFRFRMRQLRAEMMLSIVRILDKQMNNTSVILLFETGGKSLLFPGDAQIENWLYALGKPNIAKRLRNVDVYKVGHHGSLNATPKSLWGLFQKKGAEGSLDRMKSILSTMENVHGHEEAGTEVPRGKLVAALEQNTDLTTTQSYGLKEVSRLVVP